MLVDECPDLLDVLYEPFHADWRGDEPPGETPWYTNPMYSVCDGATSFAFGWVCRLGAAGGLHPSSPAAIAWSKRAEFRAVKRPERIACRASRWPT